MSQTAGRIRVTALAHWWAAGARGGLPFGRGPQVYRAGVPVRLGGAGLAWASGRGAFKTSRKQIMPSAHGLGGQVGGVGPGKVQGGGDLPGDRDTQAGQLSALVRVVAQQPDAAGAGAGAPFGAGWGW